MKKLFGLAGLVVLVATSINATAQGNRTRINSSEVSNSSEISNSTTATVSVSTAKAERDFMRYYKNAANVQWHNSPEGYKVVNFTEGETTMKSVYNRRGKWQYTIRFCNEKDISEEVKNLVIDFYRGYTINRVLEIARYDKTVTLIYLENAIYLKTARITDGEIETVEEYIKSK
jgi:hypothetical protein